MQENYLAKWLNNELSETELKDFRASEAYDSYEKIVAFSDRLQAPDFDIEKALQDFKSKSETSSPKVIAMRPYKKFLRLAAAVAVLLVGSYFYLSLEGQQIATKYAESKTFILPDNSEIILNADTSISFDEKNWDDKRNLVLDGEAFFKVAKGKKFTVTTEDGIIAVLGTEFNVENRNGFFEVTCFEGLVNVTYDGKETKLPAGNSFLAINGKIANLDAANRVHPSWIDNESTFKSIPLKYVLAEFERQHNISVETREINTDQLFTGTFSNTDINLALQSISVPSQIKFKLEDTKVLFYAEKMP